MRAGKRPPLPAELPGPVRRLVADCWAQRHSVRPPAERVMERLQALVPPDEPPPPPALLVPAQLLVEAAGNTVRSFAALFQPGGGGGAAAATQPPQSSASHATLLPGRVAPTPPVAGASAPRRYRVEL